MVKGKDLISPLKHLSNSSMVQGLQLQLDIAGPFLVYTKSKQYAGQLRGELRNQSRTKTNLLILLCIDYFTSRLEVSRLEYLSTSSVSSAIQEISSSTGWNTKRISIDPGSSLVNGIKKTNAEVANLQQQADDHEEQEVPVSQSVDLMQGLKKEGFEVKQPFAKNSWK